MYDRPRHIHTRVYRIRKLASDLSPEVRLFKIAGKDYSSDIFTKDLQRPAFEKHKAIPAEKTPCAYFGRGRQAGRQAGRALMD